MRFVSLGSGSRGNATLIESGDTRLLLDCGFAARELERRLARLDVEPDSLNGILVTHEHQDHIQGVGVMARRYRIPVWLTHGTLLSGRLGEMPDIHLVQGQQELNIDDALAPWDDYSDYLREPLTPRETAEIMSDDNMEYWHFRERMRAGDILYHFSLSAHTRQCNPGRRGVVIMRDGKPVAHRIPVFIK